MQQLAGNLQMTEQPTRRRRRMDTGWSLIRTWRGAQANCPAFVNAGLQAGGVLAYSTDLEIGEDLDGMAVVTAEFAVLDGSGSQPNQNLTQADPISRVWKLEGNDIEITPFAVPKVQVELLKITNPTSRALLISDIRALVEGSPKVLGKDVNENDVLITDALIIQGLEAQNIIGLNIQVFKDLINAMASGIDAFPVSQYVLRKTETVAVSVTTAKASHDRVGSMLTYQTLNQLEPTLANDPTALLIDAAGLHGQNDKTFYWQKRRPLTDPVSRGQWQITQEYWAFEAFNKFVYGEAV